MSHSPPRARTLKAFTIIEVLVVIGIIGLLISILMPALARARVAARETVAISNLQKTGQLFTMYAGQYRSYPYRERGSGLPAVGGGPMGQPIQGQPGVILVRWWPNGVVVGISDHFAQQWMWPGVVSQFSDWPENFATWVSPGRSTTLPNEDNITIDPDEMSNLVSIRYSNTFVAKPDLFKPGATAEDRYLGAIKPEDVTFASSKVMLWDAHLAYLPKEPNVVGEFYDAMTPMAFADGHAGLQNPTKATPGVVNPFITHVGASPINATPEGIRGRDY